MKRSIWMTLGLATIVAVAMAAPVLAQRGQTPMKGPGGPGADGGERGAWGQHDGPGRPGAWGRGGGWGRGGDGGGMGERGRGGMRPGMMLLGPEGRLLHGGGRLADDLKLTSQQQEKLRSIGEDLERRMVRSRADLQIARLDLAHDLRSDSADRSTIENRVDALSKLQGDMMKAAVSARLDVRSVLTPDQRRQLMEMRRDGGPRSETRRPGGPRSESSRRSQGGSNR